MRIAVATVRTPFIHGGAEVHAEELVKALCAEGHQAELVSIPFNPSDAIRIPEQMLACRLMDLREVDQVPIERLIALKFPAYLVPHPSKVIWLMHQHRAAYDLWEHALGGLRAAPRGRAVRDIIRLADHQLMREAKAIFTTSSNVTRRLRHFSEIDSTPLYHPPANPGAFYCADNSEDYFFFPSRLSATKRQELVIQALAVTRHPVQVKFSGLADSPPFGERLIRLARTLGVQRRVEWMGFLSETQKTDAYAHARAILFPPLDEDYGYVTLEAMLASKAVLTCTDSGGPLEFVLPEKTGFVTSPTAEGLAQAMDALWENHELAKQQGRAGRHHYEKLGLSWPNVVRRLVG